MGLPSLTTASHHASTGGNIDDATLVPRSHVRSHDLGTEKNSFEINLDHTIPLFLRHIQNRMDGSYAGAVD